MKKIALISPYNEYNYGTVLQAYALQRLLDKEGVDAAYLQYTPVVPPSFWGRLKRIIVSLFRISKSNKAIVTNNGVDDYSFFHSPEFKTFVDGYNDFINRRIKVSRQRYNPLTLPKCDEFDAFMVGSDQTWGEARYLPNSPYFLDNVSSQYPKLSYAPSIGTTHISDSYLSVLIEKLAHFQMLSCRERTNCDILRAALGREVTYVLDPTLLLTPDDWNQIARPTEGLQTKQYILCYILGEKKRISDFAEKLGKEKGLPVYYVVTRPIYLMKDNHLFATPESFLALIRDAAYVITDSFHGSILSVNYNTQFYSFTKREEANSVDNDRILEILSTFELSSRYKDDNDALEEDIDYTGVNNIVEHFREQSKAYLKKTISLE